MAGFAGPFVVRALIDGGHEVHGALRGATDPARLSGLAVGLHRVDLEDADAVDELVRRVRPEGVIHLAGLSRVDLAEDDPAAAYRVNVGTTLRLVAALREAAPGARLLSVGTGAAYGAVLPAELPVTEDVPLRPLSVYGASKAAAEIAAAQAGRSYELDVVRVRPFNHTGPGQAPAFVCAALARQLARIEAAMQEPVVRAGNLDPVRDFSDVRDVAAGYVALLERGRSGEVYNLSAGQGVSIAEVVAVLRTHARVPVRVASEPGLRRSHDVPRLVGSHARATRDTGWEPRIPLADTLGAVLDDWRRRITTSG